MLYFFTNHYQFTQVMQYDFDTNVIMQYDFDTNVIMQYDVHTYVVQFFCHALCDTMNLLQNNQKLVYENYTQNNYVLFISSMIIFFICPKHASFALHKPWCYLVLKTYMFNVLYSFHNS